MLKQRKVKCIREINLFCDNCGAIMKEVSSSASERNPNIVQYRYFCSNEKCHTVRYINKKYPQVIYEYEEDEPLGD